MTGTVEDRVKRIVGEATGHDPKSLRGDENITGDLRLDSLGLVDLVLSLEAEFGAELDETEFDDVKTVADVVKYMEGLTNG